MSYTILANEIKELLSEPRHRIKLHNLVQEETEKVYKKIEESTTQTRNVEEVAKSSISTFETETERLRTIVAYGSYFGTKDQAMILSNSLLQLARIPQSAGSVLLIDLLAYPALLILYAGGIAATASKSSSVLKGLLTTNLNRPGHQEQPLPIKVNSALLGNNAGTLLGQRNKHTPLSDHLYELLDKSLPAEIKFGKEFEDLFDKWEILLAMVVADHQREREQKWAPIGRFGWRRNSSGKNILQSIEEEIGSEGKEWFAIGLFGNSIKRSQKALEVIKELTDRRNFW